MNIVIVGAGEVGRSIAATLSGDGHNVNLVEQDVERAKRAEDELDVRVIRGNGARPQVLWDAGVREEDCAADILVACTDRDEVNMLSCWIAHSAGVRHVIARARGLEFTDSPTWGQKLGIDMMISPERSVAREILELLTVSSATRTAELLNGQAAIYAFRVAEDSPLVGKSLKDIRIDYKDLVAIVVCVERPDGESFVPDGDTVLAAQDLCYVVSYKETVYMLEELFQRKNSRPLRRVFIVGGGKIGCQLIQRIQEAYRHAEIRLLDVNEERCRRLSNELGDRNTLFLHEDGIQREVLQEEGIEEADGYVCVTDSDEVNLVYAAMAKAMGVRKSIAVVRRRLYRDMPKYMPVDAVVDLNEALSSTILRTIRYPGHARALSIIEKIDAEMLEVVLPAKHSRAGIPLSDLGLPKGVLVALLGRGNRVFVPMGSTKLEPGDHLILFASTALMREAVELFSEAQP